LKICEKEKKLSKKDFSWEEEIQRKNDLKQIRH